ncbi:hypothetical protein MKB11_005020 [Salmonella enterica]|nr:hypothetical protein [Salmonella enterica]
MKRYHVISISVLLGLIAGLAIPTVSHAAGMANPSLTVQDNYPITFWLTAIFGGCGAFFGFFGLIAKVHAFVKAPRFWGFVGLIFIALNYLILSVWWYSMAFNGVGDGYSSEYYTRAADPTGLYAYWGYSLALSLIYGFWCLLEWMHSNKQDGHSAEA